MPSYKISAAGKPRAAFSKAAAELASTRMLYRLLAAIIFLCAAGTLSRPLPFLRLGDVYRGGLFTALLALLAVNLALCIWRHRAAARLRPGLLLVHSAVLAILAGAVVSRWLCVRGPMSLTAGSMKDRTDGESGFQLPFSILLEDFRVEHYGSPAPGRVKRFRSDVAVIEAGKIVARRAIEVNRPLRWKGHALYQFGYSPEDPARSQLLVSRDPGVPLAYAGFLLLVCGLAWVFLEGLGQEGRTR